METEPTEVVQPDAGQGEQGTEGNPLYADYLNRIPEDARGVAEEAFKAWDANVQQRFTEASEFRKTIEPYEQAGITNYDPNAVGSALQVYQAIQSNPQQVVDWLVQEYGLTPAQAAQQVEETQQQEQYGSFDQFGDPAQLQSLLDQRISPLAKQLEAINHRFEQQEQQAREQQAQQHIQGQLNEIREKHPDEFSKDVQGYVEALAGKYLETDPERAIPRAWADYQQLVNTIQKSTLQAKVNTPPAAESGGTPDVNPPEIKTLAEASKYALEQMRAQRG